MPVCIVVHALNYIFTKNKICLTSSISKSSAKVFGFSCNCIHGCNGESICIIGIQLHTHRF